MRALVLCDDVYHPAAVVRAGLAPLERRGWGFDWVSHGGGWSAERLRGFPVVVLAKMNQVAAADTRPWLDESAQGPFVEHVRRGAGLLVVHAGLAGYERRPAIRALVGGAFVQHPPQCPVTVRARPGHPLGAGCAPFTLVDEHYFVDYDGREPEVFLTSSSAHGAQPAGWTRAEGAGRVCVLTPGHNLEVWLHPSYQTVIANALHWCAEAAES